MCEKYQAQSHEWISHLKGIRVSKCLTSGLCWVCHNSYFSLTSCRPIFLQLRQDPRDETPPWQEVLDGENETFPQSIIKVVLVTFPDNDVFELVRTIKEFEEKLPKLNLSAGTGKWEEATIVFLVEIRAACNFDIRIRIRIVIMMMIMISELPANSSKFQPQTWCRSLLSFINEMIFLPTQKFLIRYWCFPSSASLLRTVQFFRFNDRPTFYQVLHSQKDTFFNPSIAIRFQKAARMEKNLWKTD